MTDQPGGRSRPAPHIRAWRNALLAIFGLSGIVVASWVSRIPNVRDLLHADTAEMGLLVVGLASGSIVGLLVASHLIARIGTNTAIAWCSVVSGLGLVIAGLVTALAPGVLGIFIGLALLGAGGSIVDVAINLSGAANERALGRTIMPLFHAGFSLGTVVGAGIGALMVVLAVPIAIHVGTVGLVAGSAAAIATRKLQPAEPPLHTGQIAPHATWQSRLSVWREARIVMIGVVVLGMAFAEGSAADWLSLAMVDGHGTDNAAGSAIYGVFVAAMTLGRIGGVPLLDRFGRVPMLRACAASAIAGLALVIFVPSVAVAVIGVVLWGLGAALGFPVGLSAAADDPARANASVSAVATIGYCAFLVGPPLIGALGEQVGLLHALIVVLGLIVIAGVCAGAVRPRGMRRPVVA